MTAKHEARPRDHKLSPLDPDRIPRVERRSFSFMDRVYDVLGGLAAVFSAVVLSQAVVIGGDGITALQDHVPWHDKGTSTEQTVVAPAAFGYGQAITL